MAAGQMRDVLALEQDGALGGLDQAVYATQECGLACAGGADDGDELAGFHGEVDVAQRLLPRFSSSGGIFLSQTLDVKE
jgi:hypothetical protein